MKKVSVLVMFVLLFSYVFPSAKVDAKKFPDVKQYLEEVDYLSERSIIRGYEDGLYRPENPLTRLHAIKILLDAIEITDFTAPNPNFTDMNPKSYGYKEVAKAVQLGIISGKTAKDGTKFFDPDNHLTRGQMAKVIVESKKLAIKQTTFFLDVPPSDGFHDYISTLASERITGGYADGTYRPANNISRLHFAVFVARMLEDRFKPSEVNKAPSFLKDRTKTYSWIYYDDGEVIETKLQKSDLEYSGPSSWDLWKEQDGASEGYFIANESEKGLFEIGCRYFDRIVCESYGEEPSPELHYPLYVGKKWGLNSTSRTVVSISQEVSIRAKIYKNVIEVKDADGWHYFYAPNVGLIRTVDNGHVFAELVELN
ncbi:S-layer homology domain-containing protein [Sporosarcina sp. CAU 1771]